MIPMTVAKLAEQSGLSVSLIEKAVRAGHLAAVVKNYPTMVEPEVFAQWVRNGRKTEREGRRNVQKTPEREVAVDLAPKGLKHTHGHGKDKKGGKGERSKKGRAEKPIIYYPDFTGGVENAGA